jgi:hypothetical protein
LSQIKQKKRPLNTFSHTFEITKVHKTVDSFFDFIVILIPVRHILLLFCYFDFQKIAFFLNFFEQKKRYPLCIRTGVPPSGARCVLASRDGPNSVGGAIQHLQVTGGQMHDEVGSGSDYEFL